MTQQFALSLPPPPEASAGAPALPVPLPPPEPPPVAVPPAHAPAISPAYTPPPVQPVAVMAIPRLGEAAFVDLLGEALASAAAGTPLPTVLKRLREGCRRGADADPSPDPARLVDAAYVATLQDVLAAAAAGLPRPAVLEQLRGLYGRCTGTAPWATPAPERTAPAHGPAFDGTRFRLGKLCAHGHRHAGTDQSLRHRDSGGCVVCQTARARQSSARGGRVPAVGLGRPRRPAGALLEATAALVDQADGGRRPLTRRDVLERQILAVLQRCAPSSLTPVQIAQALGGAQAEIQGMCFALAQLGTIARVSPGQYCYRPTPGTA